LKAGLPPPPLARPLLACGQPPLVLNATRPTPLTTVRRRRRTFCGVKLRGLGRSKYL